MLDIKNFEWFKKSMAPSLIKYELNYKSFAEGDFGSLDQIEFNSKDIGGNIDFWELGWLGIFVWNYGKEEQVLNVLLEPHQEEEKEEAFRKLREILGVGSRNGS